MHLFQVCTFIGQVTAIPFLVRGLFRFALKSTASLVLIVASVLVIFSSIRWLMRPKPDSPEGLLARANELAWNNDWRPAATLFFEAQLLFERKCDHDTLCTQK